MNQHTSPLKTLEAHDATSLVTCKFHQIKSSAAGPSFYYSGFSEVQVSTQKCSYHHAGVLSLSGGSWALNSGPLTLLPDPFCP